MLVILANAKGKLWLDMTGYTNSNYHDDNQQSVIRPLNTIDKATTAEVRRVQEEGDMQSDRTAGIAYIKGLGATGKGPESSGTISESATPLQTKGKSSNKQRAISEKGKMTSWICNFGEPICNFPKRMLVCHP